MTATVSHDPKAAPTAAPTPTTSPAMPEAEPPSLRSEDLLRGAREVVIRHRNDQYRLRLTGNDKLILVK